MFLPNQTVFLVVVTIMMTSKVYCLSLSAENLKLQLPTSNSLMVHHKTTFLDNKAVISDDILVSSFEGNNAEIRAEARGAAVRAGAGGSANPNAPMWTDGLGTWSGHCTSIFCSPTFLLLSFVLIGPLLLIIIMACLFGYYHCLWDGCGGGAGKGGEETGKKVAKVQK